MDDGPDRYPRLRAKEVRGAMRLANANAALWASGNGLVSTLLVIYLASELGAQGTSIGLILAAPRFAGVLRLAVPALMARVHRRKVICIAAYIASSMVLCTVPLVAVTADRQRQVPTLALLVAAWCVYHLLEYVGTVALWSWLGDLAPAPIRGRLLGQRERWLVAGRVMGLCGSATLAVLWALWLPEAGRWQSLALSAMVGAGFMMLAVVPLWRMPAVQYAPSAVPQAPWRTYFHALIDRQYWRLLLFSCCFSIVNGVTAAAQEVYPIRVLRLDYAARQMLHGLMRTGQFLIAPWIGRLADRIGNRPVLIVSQLITATGPLFFLAATPERPWLVAGAFVVWIAYAGLNVGLDNLKLKLAPWHNNAPYLALFHALSDLANGVAIVAGGVLLDQLVGRSGGAAGSTSAMAMYTQVFLFAWIGRTLLAALVARLIEPGARTVGDVLRRS